VLLMELWGGRPPFRRRTNEEIDAAMRGPHPKPSDADPRLLPLDETMASAMSLDAPCRPQQADDLGRALRRFLSGVDLGDVARQLGGRVRDARARPSVAATETRVVLQRPPSRPTGAQVGTKTFAARPELSYRAGSGPEEATRKLVSTPAPSSAAAPAAAPAAATPSVAAPASAATPSAAQPSPRNLETLATSPIETGPRGDGAERPTPRLWVRLALGGSLVAVAAFLLGRGVPARTSDPTPPRASSVSGGAPAATGVSAFPSAAPGQPAAAPDPSGAPPPRATPAERGQVVLLGDGTLVRVDGAPYGACPTRVSVEPGTHTFAFSFPATGESKSERVILRARDRITLRADFTTAVPTIRLER